MMDTWECLRGQRVCVRLGGSVRDDRSVSGVPRQARSELSVPSVSQRRTDCRSVSAAEWSGRDGGESAPTGDAS